MEKRRTSIFENGLIWFGAAVSLAEILTGTYFAPLGMKQGLWAILIGHIIGGILLFAAGLMGGLVRKSAMETAKMSFGSRGGLLFSLLNILQLVGWTAIMIYDGALAANGIWDIGSRIWCIAIGGLIILWICIGIRNLGKINTAAMGALFLLTVVLSFVIFSRGGLPAAGGEGLSFGAAVELSVAMPLSWLPLISDYTREAEKPVKATAVSAVTYSLVSSWMYVIGMGAALFAGSTDIARILLKAGLGAAGLLIIVFSTVTTTFLDAFSAGVSGESLSEKVNGSHAAVCVAAIGTLGAMFLPLGDITGFLYFIGSVFAPMIAVQIADFFILRHRSLTGAFRMTNLAVWAAGFILYRLLMRLDLILGSTLPDMIITMALCVAADRIKSRFR